ncbi:retinol dehydrogenase 7-like [Rhinatrema bivittatum]|uniref:retinol dehydrogenase 7-like n=1 Tax=Rhinatrema bivittatum TaxID=194408 RepID=UPI0011298D0F|nr:retinol dehydrogenase 7-like [Rhinatrema bivittatum]
MWLWLLALLGLYLLYRWYRERQILPNLPNKYVLITGCDSGFGSVLARQLDRRGLRVLAACLTQRGAELLKEATSQRLQTIILDVADSQSVAAAADWVKQQVGVRGLWGLVNNAGIGTPVGPNEWLTKDDFVKVLNVNLVGVIDVTLSLLPLLRKAKGRLVNVSSILGRVACTGGGYCISKHGVEAFSDSLRRDLRPFGVKVAIIEPSMFRTSIIDAQIIEQSYQRSWSRMPPEIKEIYGQQYFEKRSKNVSHVVSGASSKLSLVTDCMEHALIAVHPRTRYSVGWAAKLFYIPVSYLPTALADVLLTRSSPKPAHTA